MGVDAPYLERPIEEPVESISEMSSRIVREAAKNPGFQEMVRIQILKWQREFGGKNLKESYAYQYLVGGSPEGMAGDEVLNNKIEEFIKVKAAELKD